MPPAPAATANSAATRARDLQRGRESSLSSRKQDEEDRRRARGRRPPGRCWRRRGTASTTRRRPRSSGGRSVVSRFRKSKIAVPARIEAGREGRPGDRRLRRDRRAQRREGPLLAQLRQVRELALVHPLLGQLGVGAVEAEHDGPRTAGAVGGGRRERAERGDTERQEEREGGSSLRRAARARIGSLRKLLRKSPRHEAGGRTSQC